MIKKLVGNQKAIEISKKEIKENDIYIKINLNALWVAMNDLSAGALKLWLYFAKNQDGYTFALSSTDAKDFGIKIKQYNNAIHELIEKNYLQESIIEGKYEGYKFIEMPRELPIEIEKTLSENKEEANEKIKKRILKEGF